MLTYCILRTSCAMGGNRCLARRKWKPCSFSPPMEQSNKLKDFVLFDLLRGGNSGTVFQNLQEGPECYELNPLFSLPLSRALATPLVQLQPFFSFSSQAESPLLILYQTIRHLLDCCLYRSN
mmetsp:Transcript_17626/g.43380  ORF Transcript_17626/g.43380 Transcript_17626/m.43380 type:complete len:122 (-) Transcript_17626:534-899(-)